MRPLSYYMSCSRLLLLWGRLAREKYVEKYSVLKVRECMVGDTYIYNSIYQQHGKQEVGKTK